VVSLLRRAMAAVGNKDPRWPEWATDRVDSLVEIGDEAGARAQVDELEATEAAPNSGHRAWAAVARTHFEAFFGGFDPGPTLDAMANAIDVFAAAKNERGLARAWLRSTWVPWVYMNVRDAENEVTR
jgi:hypothetical protein